MSENDSKENKLEAIVALAKRRGFIYPGSDIYGGLAGTWDYGPLGVALKRNVQNLWWRIFIEERSDMYGMDAAILMKSDVWKASGHVSGFSDPLVECAKCKKRFRADILENEKKCAECGGELGGVRQFNMMFQTHVGVINDETSISYLRPETAQGMFVNFKNVVDSFHPKLPFGLGQIGKAFRNEIAPRDFLFRAREFEQMEIEYFVKESEWEKYFENWRILMLEWMKVIGLSQEKVHELEVSAEDRAHYSRRTIDFEYDFPFGRKELYGLAYRADFDLRNHQSVSGVSLEYYDEETKERLIPHVIEPTFGVDRTILAILSDSLSVDNLGDEPRTYLKLSPQIAPVRVAVFPLLKNKPDLVSKAQQVFLLIKENIPNVVFDDNGNIGKRYRRQDEIGTPHCITIDFETLENDTVTIRDRDSGEQKRIKIEEIIKDLVS